VTTFLLIPIFTRTSLAKILETKPTTFNEIKQAVNSILEFASTNALSKNEKLADGYFKIKSKRLKKKYAA